MTTASLEKGGKVGRRECKMTSHCRGYMEQGLLLICATGIMNNHENSPL